MNRLPLTPAASGLVVFDVLETGHFAFVWPGQRWPETPEAVTAVVRFLAEHEILREFGGRIHWRVSRRYFPSSSQNVLGLFAPAGISFLLGSADELSALQPTAETLASDDPARSFLAQAASAGTARAAELPFRWERILSSPSPDIPECHGVLQHPIFPPGPVPGWLQVDTAPLPDPDPSCPHLKTLFTAWPGLSPETHCVLTSYLLGAFHRDSLTQPRPLLWVDSWEQGVGKSTSCEAIAAVIDPTIRTLAIDRHSNAAEEIVAMLAHGGRALVVPNLSHRRHFNDTLLATLCTDTGQSRRVKYAAKSTTFHGTLGMASAVLGSVTLHRDLISRIWRAELPGRLQNHMTPHPRSYAENNRLAIQAEILHCHRQAKPWDLPATSRYPQFEAAALSAYSVLTKIPHEEAAARLGRAITSSNVYHDAAMFSLYRTHRDLFSESFSRWDDEPLRSAEYLSVYEGATAFGYTLKKGKWTTF